MVREQTCQWALTHCGTGAAAHLRVVIFVWLSTSASLVTPSSPMQLRSRL